MKVATSILGIAILTGSSALAQTQATQGFESSTTELPYTSVGVTIATNTSTPQNGTPRNTPYHRSGSSAWAALNTSGQPLTQQLTFQNLRYRGNATGNAFEFRLAALATQPNQGLDRGDYVLVEISTNNGSSFAPVLQVTGGLARNNGQPAESAWNYDATGIAATTFNVTAPPTTATEFVAPQDQTTTGFATVRVSITGIPVNGFADVIIRITTFNNENNEIWAIDDFIATSSLTLPVELTSFSGTRQTNRVLLSWATAQEKNNDRFEVERSADGSQFALVATVRGKGNTTTASSYTATDAKPLTGTSYYRLRQVDFDGTATYSQVVVVRNNTQQVYLTPNPATSQLGFEYAGGELQWRIVNSVGQLMKKGSAQASSSVDVSSLRAGVYFFEVSTGGQRSVQKFFKQD
ncbi:T9SS type A sorting domain-containing protein [Hymenobacter latericus]|uniref:T9SS type A sorting domain-containing protein n=1 Tax=Hymenobacter sp. YIM 151858-1 TaxID=2987688 RepID=UPI0022273BEC|nr:T9SS type A sorting domain-containing protein [Hymenobacter sp. YIM 151858-1]UYZ59134.1 T9SS type A sorting domain-containing protein [Hymenobacter sp. YIM 151858-1]